jgi:hypothetical protein
MPRLRRSIAGLAARIILVAVTLGATIESQPARSAGMSKASNHAPLQQSSTAAAVDRTATAPSVYLNVPMAHPERPTTIPDYELNQPDAHDPAKFLSVQSHVDGVSWSSWGGSTATGSGTVVVSSRDTRPGHAQPYGSQSVAVSIVASDLVSCGGQQLYTAYTLTLTERAAEGVVIENEQHPREPERPLVGAGSTTGFSSGGGSSTGSLVRPSGLEPPRTKRSTWPSTSSADARYVRPRPDRPFCAVYGTYGTHRTN